ncbi:MAG: aldehyde ferredoxin oxidoreductase family protein [Clostridiales bacterium]|nr:aldehyde ferredoxin oxidoreductase family protein [Candidatus Crickella equi]
MKSCTGKILVVDLTAGTTRVEQIPDEVYEAVLAGKGLGAWYLYKNIPADADPMGPENILGFCSGALTGTGALMTGRVNIVCKSPLTGGWGDANCGGVFAPAIKQCGYDAIFVSGISDKPVYLYCDNKGAEIRDAAEYWGMDAVEAERRLRQDAGSQKKPCVAVIGESGEKLSLISGICNEEGRIAARSGVGAVMGSKKLKALVLAGSKKMPCADRVKVNKISKELGRKINKVVLPPGMGLSLAVGGVGMGRMPAMPLDGSVINYLFKEWGTPSNTPTAIMSGDGPLKNWSAGPSEAEGPSMAIEFNPDKINKIETAKYHCYSCPLGCGGKLDISKVGYSEFYETHKPEYETIQAFGALCMNKDLDSVLYINELLNRAGIDAISIGNTVAWAIECYENGILTAEQTDGLELRWGNTQAIIALVKKIIAREGFGDALADGVKRAAAKFGGEEYAMHVGGQEPGMHDTRNDPQLGIHMVAEPAPGKHTIGMAIQYGAMSLCDICSWAPPAKLHNKKEDLEPTETMALQSKANAAYSMLIDGAGGCYYAEMMGVHMWKIVDYLNAAADWNYDGDHYMEIGCRIQTIRQMFNIKHGYDPAAVVLPKRMQGEPPLKAGPLKGVKLNNKEQVSMHWKAFGWDEKTGAPLAETIESLGINKLMEV